MLRAGTTCAEAINFLDNDLVAGTLNDVSVQEGQSVAAGQRIGGVGGSRTPEGPHIEFQIRAPGGEAVDPLGWLRRRSPA